MASALGEVNWTSIGPGGGSFLMSSAIQPDNEDIIYVGGDIEGVIKTVDGGTTWKVKNTGINGGNRPAGVYGIQEIVIDPSNYQTVYACTWAGAFKSTNGADMWELIFPVQLEEDNIFVSYLAVDPDNSDILYMGIGNADFNSDGQGALYRSINAGSSWELLAVDMGDETVVHSIVVDPTSPSGNRILFVSTGNGVFRSTDNGESWSSVNDGLPHLNTRRLETFVTDSSLTLFLSMKTEGDPSNTNSFAGGIYKTTDAGDTWVSINGDLPTLPYEDPDDPPPFYDYWKLQIHPSNQDIIYTASNIGGWADLWGIHSTSDGGTHWEKIDTDITYGWLDDVWWNDESASLLSLAPSNPNVLIAAGDAHIQMTQNAGETWAHVYTDPVNGNWLGRGIELMNPFAIGFHPTNPDVVYVGYDDMGFFRYQPGKSSRL